MKFVSDKFRVYWQQAKDFCVYKVLHADDPPHRLALGIAIGIFVTFMPLIGFQMLLAFFLAWLLKANKLVGVPLVWISNPLTLVPIYYPCYWLGCKLLGIPVVSEEWERVQHNWHTLVADPATTGEDKFRFWWDSLLEFVGPLWLGCIILGPIAGVISYYASLYAIRRYRLRRWGQLMPPRLTAAEDADTSPPGDARSHSQESSSGGNAA